MKNQKTFAPTMILLLLLVSFVIAQSLSPCANNRTDWNPPLWRLVDRRDASRVRAFVLASTALDLPDTALADVYRVAGGAGRVYFMSLNRNCSDADLVGDVDRADLTAHLDAASIDRIGALIDRLRDALQPATFASLFAAWRSTPLAVLAQRLSIYSAVLYGAAEQKNDSAFVSMLFRDAQLVPSSLDERVAARVENCSRAAPLALESAERSCHAYIGVYDDPSVKQSLVDVLLPEFEAVLLRGVPPLRVLREHQLSQAYRCGDVSALLTHYSSQGIDSWHEPLTGAAGDWLDEQILFARNRVLVKSMMEIMDSVAVPMFVVDSSNLLALDRFNKGRPTLKSELETNGLRFQLISPNSINIELCESIVENKSTASTTTPIIIFTVVTVALVIFIIIMSIVIIRLYRNRRRIVRV